MGYLKAFSSILFHAVQQLQVCDCVACARSGPVLAEEETDSETDGGHAGGHAGGHGSQPRGKGNGGVLDKSSTSSQGEVELFSPRRKSDRLSGCPMIHGHKMSEDIDLSFRNNGQSLPPSSLSSACRLCRYPQLCCSLRLLRTFLIT